MITDVPLPSRLQIGGGALGGLADLLGSLGVRRPLIVTDAFMARTEAFGRLRSSLDKADMETGVFAEVEPDPTSASVSRAAEQFRQGRHDGLIGFGGGSPIDTAKAANLLAAAGVPLRELKAPAVVTQKAAPMVAIPTTAGTGSEVSRFTVITDERDSEKMLIAGPACVPAAAIVDYELTLSAPFRLTADTGIDSLTHAIEATVSRRRNAFSTGMARAAMGTIARSIRTVCAEPANHAAREGMMLAATQAGLAFTSASVALVHGMSRPLGAFFHVPHGLSNAMLLPLVTEWSCEAARPEYALCAREMGLATAAHSDADATTLLVEGLRALNRDLQVPTPAQYGISAESYFSVIERMAEQASLSGSPANNPRVPTRAELISLYERAYGAARGEQA